MFGGMYVLLKQQLLVEEIRLRNDDAYVIAVTALMQMDTLSARVNTCGEGVLTKRLNVVFV